MKGIVFIAVVTAVPPVTAATAAAAFVRSQHHVTTTTTTTTININISVVVFVKVVVVWAAVVRVILSISLPPYGRGRRPAALVTALLPPLLLLGLSVLGTVLAVMVMPCWCGAAAAAGLWRWSEGEAAEG